MLRVNIQAWVLSEETQRDVREGLSDRKLSKSVVDVELGGYEAALQFYDKNATPHLVILETNSVADELLREIETLAEVCDSGTSLLLAGSQNDIQMYRELIRRGVSDYLITPISPRTMLETVNNIFVDPEAPPMGRTLSFYGCRGGSGSSSIAHNIASILSEEMDEDVVLIDMDVAFGTAALGFNLEASQGIHSALADPDRLDEVLLERFLLPYGENLKILGSPATLEFENTIRTESMDRLIDLTRRKSSYVILDVPHMWMPWTRPVLADADQTVLISTMDLAGLRDMKNLYERLSKQRGETAPVYLALNHIGAFKKTELTQKDFESALERDADVALIHDPGLFGEASNNGQTLAEVSSKHKIVENLREFAQLLTGRQPVKKSKSKFSFSLGKSKN